MNSKEYWKKRAIELMVSDMKETDNLHKDLKESYEKAIAQINKEIAVLYGRFAKDNQVDFNRAQELIKGSEYREWRKDIEGYLKAIENAISDETSEALLLELNTLAMRSRVTRLEALEGQINKAMVDLAVEEGAKVGEHLETVLSENYYSAMYASFKAGEIKAIDLAIKHMVKLSEDDVKRALTLPWSGANYSKNIWDRHYQVEQKVKKLVTQSVLNGTSIQNLSKQITDELGKSYKHAAERLVRTETAFAKGQADLLCFEKLGEEKYQYLATLDSKTSDACQELDGKVFEVSKAVPGKNYPPMHPHCRSTTISYRPDREGTRVARGADGKSYEVDRNMTYKEWKKKYVDVDGGKVNDSIAKPSESKPLKTSKDLAKEYKLPTRKKGKTHEQKMAEMTAKRDAMRESNKKERAALEAVKEAKAKREGTKVFSQKQLDKMNITKLREEARQLAHTYYRSGISGISFKGEEEINKAVASLAKAGSKTSLKKDIRAMQKKLKAWRGY